MTGQILALGGGGFLMEPDDARIDDYALALCGNPVPRVCFLPTASGDSDVLLDAFYGAFPPGRARASHISLFRRQRKDLAGPVQSADLIYIAGGNTANLLALWRLHGLDQLVMDAYRAGAVIVGLSAGACCLFEGCLSDSFGPALTPISDGLGLLTGTFCPHYGNGNRRPRFRQVIGEGFASGIAVDDGAALHFVGGELTRVLTTRDRAGAYRVFKRDRVQEEALPTTLLESS